MLLLESDMKKTKNSLQCLEAVLPVEELIKEYIDNGAEIENFIQLKMPHVPKTRLKANYLYSSKDGLERRYRINWLLKTQDNNSMVETYSIAKSALIKVVWNDGNYEIVNL